MNQLQTSIDMDKDITEIRRLGKEEGTKQKAYSNRIKNTEPTDGHFQGKE